MLRGQNIQRIEVVAPEEEELFIIRRSVQAAYSILFNESYPVVL
jgi:hypothetical protein